LASFFLAHGENGEPLGPERFDSPEQFGPELTAEGLTVEGLVAEGRSRTIPVEPHEYQALNLIAKVRFSPGSPPQK